MMIMIMNDDDALTISKFDWNVERKSAQVVKLPTKLNAWTTKKLYNACEEEYNINKNVSLKYPCSVPLDIISSPTRCINIQYCFRRVECTAKLLLC